MSAVRIVTQEDGPPVPVMTSQTSLERVWAYLGVTMVLFAAIGTWLIWFSALLRQNLQEEPIREGCRRTMLECVETVIIQRGGVRR